MKKKDKQFLEFFFLEAHDQSCTICYTAMLLSFCLGTLDPTHGQFLRDILSGIIVRENSSNSCGPEQALPADEEDDDLAEDEVGADPEPLLLLQPILRAIAETQRQMAGKDGSGRRKLAQKRLEEYCVAGTAKQYKYLKRSVNLTKQLYGFSDQELALLILP